MEKLALFKALEKPALFHPSVTLDKRLTHIYETLQDMFLLLIINTNRYRLSFRRLPVVFLARMLAVRATLWCGAEHLYRIQDALKK